ncbi:MAG: PEP-CTERM sorting domain-containing protein [Terriglobia bacterium]
MKRLSLRSVALLIALCFLTVGVASAGTVSLTPITPAFAVSPADVTVNVPFPTAGDAYCSATNGCGTIPSGGETAFQYTAGDYVVSSIFVLPTASVDDLTANWQFQDFLGNYNGTPTTETWFVYVNGVAVAAAVLPDDNYNGDIGTVSGTINFAGIAPVAGGYQVSLVLQNTVGFGEGSAAWLDGGTTGLSFATPEPASILLLGTSLGGLVLRKLRRKKS